MSAAKTTSFGQIYVSFTEKAILECTAKSPVKRIHTEGWMTLFNTKIVDKKCFNLI